MKSAALTIISLWLLLFKANGQTNADCLAIMEKADSAITESNYSLALTKLRAFKVCSPESAAAADEKIQKVFDLIKGQRDSAISARNEAQKALKRESKAKAEALRQKTMAIKEANRSTALYWSSIAESLPPQEGIRLLEKARFKDSTIKFVDEMLERIFRAAPEHRFAEKFRFDRINQWDLQGNKGIVSINNAFYQLKIDSAVHIEKKFDFLDEIPNKGYIDFSFDYKYAVLTVWKGLTSSKDMIFDLNTQKTPDFISSSVENQFILSSNKKYLVTWVDRSKIKIINLVSGKVVLEFEEGKNMRSFSFPSPQNPSDYNIEHNDFSERFLAIERLDSSIILFDLDRCQPYLSSRETQRIEEYQFSQDGKWICASVNDSVHIWNTRSDAEVQYWSFNTAQIFHRNDLKRIFLSNNLLMIKNKELNEIQIYNLEEQKYIGRVKMTYDHKMSEEDVKLYEKYIEVSSNGKYLIIPTNSYSVTSYSADLTVIDLETKKLPQFIEKDPIGYIHFSSDKNFLFNKYRDSSTVVWNLSDGKKIKIKADSINDIRFENNTKWMLTRNELGNYIRLWDYSGDGNIHFLGQYDWYTNHRIAFFNNGKYILRTFSNLIEKGGISYIDDRYTLFQPKWTSDEDVMVANKKIKTAEFSRTGSYLAISNDTILNIVNIRKQQYLGFPDSSHFSSAEFSANDRYIICKDKKWADTVYKVSEDSLVKVEGWYGKQGRHYYFSPDGNFLLSENKDLTTSVLDLTDDSNFIFKGIFNRYDLYSTRDDSIWVFTKNGGVRNIKNLITNKKPAFLENENAFDVIEFSADRNFLLTVSGNKVKVWNFATGLSYGFPRVSNCRYSTNGKYLLSCFPGDSCNLQKLESGKKPDFLEKESNPVKIKFEGASDQWIFTSTQFGDKIDNTVYDKLWIEKNGKAFPILVSEYDYKISPDQNWIFTWSKDSSGFRSAKLVNTSTKKVPLSFKFDISPTIVFSSDSRWICINNQIYDLTSDFTMPSLTSYGYNIKFSANGNFVFSIDEFKVMCWDLKNKKNFATYWVTQEIKNYFLSTDSNAVYIVSGKAIAKFNTQEPGNYFKWTGHEPCEYAAKEIREWIKLFGRKYLNDLYAQY